MGHIEQIKQWVDFATTHDAAEESVLDMMHTLIALHDRLTTANADLQQRLDAAEEALKVAQGEVESLRVTNKYLGGNNVSLYRALAAAKTEILAGDDENAGLHLKCIGYLGQIITANRKQEEAESALTAANSRVGRLREALGKLAKEYKPFNMSIISLMGKIAYDAIEADDAKEGM